MKYLEINLIKNAQNLKYTWKATQALLSKLKDIIVWDKQTS